MSINRFKSVLILIGLLACSACGQRDNGDVAKLQAELDAARAEATAAQAKLALGNNQSKPDSAPEQSEEKTRLDPPEDPHDAKSGSPEFAIEKGKDGLVLQPLGAEVVMAENGDIEMLVFREAALTDRGAEFGLEKIKGLKKLRGIRMHLSANSDFVLQQLPTLGFDRLDTVILIGAPVTSQGLANLAKLPALRNISFRSCQVDPDAWASLWKQRELKRLEIAAGLDLAGTKWSIEDEHVAGIGNLRKLEVLYLGYTSITDQTIAEIRQCTDLKALFLPNTGITDTGLNSLKTFKNLELLELSGTTVTDAGLESLVALPKLQRLYLVSANSVSEGGIEKLQWALPQCRIERASGASINDYP